MTVPVQRSERSVPSDAGMKSGRNRAILTLGGLTLVGFLFVLALPPISQDPQYHHFVDGRTFLGIPNSFDVFSNLSFVVMGSLGLLFLLRHSHEEPGRVFSDRREIYPCIGLYLGVLLTGFGSAFYHWSPSHGSLVWDRLPMTMIFMSFLASIISERISPKAGLIALFPLLALGIVSVLAWYGSEQRGAGDLRLYLLIQFYPVVLILFILWAFPSQYSHQGNILLMLGFYALAKITETLDKQIFLTAGMVSGHTLKHLLAATAILCHLMMLAKRRPRDGKRSFPKAV